MPEAIENYKGLNEGARLRSQALSVWLGAGAIIFLWMSSIILAPILAASHLDGAAAPIYGFFSFICHQMPDRSFFIEGHKFAVCSRCFGVYFGLFAGWLSYPLWRTLDNIEPLPRIWLLASVIPIGVDWSLGVFDIWANTFASRFITGLVLGVACAIYIIPALVEIFRNLSSRRTATPAG